MNSVKMLAIKSYLNNVPKLKAMADRVNCASLSVIACQLQKRLEDFG
jgi:hypothetical protein